MDRAEYLDFADNVRRGIWEELDPLEGEIEDSEELPLERIMPILRSIGAFGFLVPTHYGGVALTISQYLPLLAEFAKIQGGIRVLVHVHNSFAHALSEIGSTSQQHEVLPGAATGEKSVAFALTEPDHGTGRDLGTRAARRTDGYVLNGRKWLITNSNIATHFIVFAKTAEGEVSAFLIRRSTPGLSIEALPETMGCKGGEHGLLTFKDAVVPEESLIGDPGQGQEHLERALQISRVFIAASSLGTSQRALELSVEHAKARVTFGKPIASRQAVQRYLAEMGADVYALRQVLADAAAKWDRGEAIPAESAMCKMIGMDVVGRVTDRALLVHGGIGYTRQLPIERLYRDARLNWLEEGPPTIQYMVAASTLTDGYEWNDAFSSI